MIRLRDKVLSGSIMMGVLKDVRLQMKPGVTAEEIAAEIAGGGDERSQYAKVAGKLQGMTPIVALADHALKQSLIEKLQAATPVVIDEVANYIYKGTEQEHFGVKDFPNCAPPWESFWMEFAAPDYIGSETWGKQPWSGPKKIGYLIESYSPEDFKAAQGNRLLPEEEIDQAKWCMVAQGIAEWRGIGQEPVAVLLPLHFYLVNPDGQLGKRWATFARDVVEDAIDEIAAMTQPWTFPMFMALSFLHCKNVATRIVEPEKKLSRAFERRHGRPLSKHHVIEIRPITEMLEREGGASTHGVARALHITRGHFRDYTQRGLFGKLKGVFWFDQHLRGTSQAGTVTQEFEVKGPRRA